MADVSVGDIYIEKAKAPETLGCYPPTELTMHPYRWGIIESELKALKGDVKWEVSEEDGSTVVWIEDLKLRLDMNFPTDVILVS